jgi:hypothetical protein
VRNDARPVPPAFIIIYIKVTFIYEIGIIEIVYKKSVTVESGIGGDSWGNRSHG